jgi:hypothetical protein
MGNFVIFEVCNSRNFAVRGVAPLHQAVDRVHFVSMFLVKSREKTKKDRKRIWGKKLKMLDNR